MENLINCSRCNTNLIEIDTFCSNCGYPEKGSQHDKDLYERSIQLKKNVIKGAEKKLRSVKILLYVLAGINVIAGIFFLTDYQTFADGIGCLISAIIFIGCVIWVNKQPLTGILAAFIFWVLLQISSILIDPSQIFSGLLLKIFFIIIFIKGISSAQDVNKINTQLKEMNAA